MILLKSSFPVNVPVNTQIRTNGGCVSCSGSNKSNYLQVFNRFKPHTSKCSWRHWNLVYYTQTFVQDFPTQTFVQHSLDYVRSLSKPVTTGQVGREQGRFVGRFVGTCRPPHDISPSLKAYGRASLPWPMSHDNVCIEVLPVWVFPSWQRPGTIEMFI